MSIRVTLAPETDGVIATVEGEVLGLFPFRMSVTCTRNEAREIAAGIQRALDGLTQTVDIDDSGMYDDNP